MEVAARNEVILVGRLAALPVDVELPSGDVLKTWRLVVDRSPSKRAVPEGVRPTTVDVVKCVGWTAVVQRAAASWQVGDVVAVEGALRRRFWRTPGGPSSTHEVEVRKAKRVSRAA